MTINPAVIGQNTQLVTSKLVIISSWMGDIRATVRFYRSGDITLEWNCPPLLHIKDFNDIYAKIERVTKELRNEVKQILKEEQEKAEKAVEEEEELEKVEA